MAEAKTENFTRLSATERDVMVCLVGLVNSDDEREPSGQDVAQVLDRVRGHRTADATVYNALSSLVTKGFVEKNDIDTRRNTYSVTEQGSYAIRRHAERFNDAL
jgi:DNA-binding PadR family transcriptional regulator